MTCCHVEINIIKCKILPKLCNKLKYQALNQPRDERANLATNLKELGKRR